LQLSLAELHLLLKRELFIQDRAGECPVYCLLFIHPPSLFAKITSFLYSSFSVQTGGKGVEGAYGGS